MSIILNKNISKLGFNKYSNKKLSVNTDRFSKENLN